MFLVMLETSYLEDELESSLEPSWPKLVEPLEKLVDRLQVVWEAVNHLKAVKDTAELRTAIEEIQPEKVKFELKLGQSKPIYNAFKAISNMWRKQKEDVLADVLNALESQGTWRKLRLISNAKVPFLRLEHNLQRISCDISINNLNGQMKSKLLFWITQIDERFRDMVLLVKEWAKAHDINESNSGSLNSYCLTLLVLFHFQTCVPAILPLLKKLYPGDLAHDLSGNSRWVHAMKWSGQKNFARARTVPFLVASVAEDNILQV